MAAKAVTPTCSISFLLLKPVDLSIQHPWKQMTTVLQSLNNFLAAERNRGIAPDLLSRWHPGMETQVLVSSVGGWPVEEKPGCFTNGKETWWHVRVPKHADSEPTFNDYPLTWFFEDHAESIGSTGWDWQARRSRWLGFDFDALVGHAKGVGIEDEELEAVKEKAQALPYVEVRRSTGGAGLHLYVHVDVETENHTVHAGLARCVLGMMTTATGFDFASRIDCCGGNMWIWRKDLEPGGPGLELLKMATHQLTETDLPINWRDNVAVVKRGRGKVATDESVAALATAIKEVPLDAEHHALIAKLGESDYTTIWNNDYHCLHTKTKGLQDIFEAGGVKGVFRTVSEGNNPADPNCYMFPLEGGAWRVYRFANAAEADTWTTDAAGRTTCFFNKRATLKTAALFYGGVEDAETQEFVTTYEGAIATARCLGESLILPDEAQGREVRMGKSKDGRLVVKIRKDTKEAAAAGWIDKGKSSYKVMKALVDEREESQSQYDEVFRKLVSTVGDDAGWMMRNENDWVPCLKDDIKNLLDSRGVLKNDISPLLGNALYKPWKLVNLPFQDEYPGGRQWNLDAAQLAYESAQIDDGEAIHPTWDMILAHCGSDLDDYVKDLPWCQDAHILTGRDYLKAWVACLFRCPFEPLPYLFFFGVQNSGKSIFHEALSLLMTKGYTIADKALTNRNDFNGELANAILCVVEEKDISKAPGAYAKIKDWVTAPNLSIRKMRTDAFMQPNTTHWVQCANHRTECAIAPGDTRIVVMYVRKPEVDLPKEPLKDRLREEAPHFLATIMNMELPPRLGRLRLPVVETQNKIDAANLNQCELQAFVDDTLEPFKGGRLKLNEFNDRFIPTLDTDSTWQRGAKTADFEKLSPPLKVAKSNGPRVIFDVRWASPYSLSM